jgi:hypothetical protein
MIYFSITTYIRTETRPDKSGDINQERTIVLKTDHRKPSKDLATKVKPITDPTILWVPEIGILKKVAKLLKKAPPIKNKV